MITAETITHEQIGAVWRLAFAPAQGVHGNPDLAHASKVALNAHGDFTTTEQQAARAQCAAILNRRCSACGALCDHAAWNGIDCPWCPSGALPPVGSFITEGMGTYQVLEHVGGTRLRVRSRVGSVVDVDYADSGYRDRRNAWRRA